MLVFLLLVAQVWPGGDLAFARMPRVNLSPQTVRAVVRYAPSVDRLARSRYGVTGRQLLARLVAGESHDNPGAVSPAGARGRAQFMPGTRQAVLSRYGIDPWGTADEAVHAAALHLRGKLGNATGLEGYNPGDPGYASYILGQRTDLGSEARRIGAGTEATRVDTQAPGAPDAAGAPGVAALLASLGVGKPPAPPATAPQAPAGLDARASLPLPLLPGGGVPVPESGGGPAPKPQIGDLLARAAGLTQGGLSPVASGGGGQEQGGGQVVAGRGRWPTARPGKIIGVPYSGTHTLGNWQSDNAIDIAVPEGTRVLSTGDGRVVKVKGAYHGGADRFDGFQVTIETPSGGRFYTHLSGVDVKAGQRVRRGQVIGRSGLANGVAHLHFGVEHGDPRKFVR